jgi:hypothetical protein
VRQAERVQLVGLKTDLTSLLVLERLLGPVLEHTVAMKQRLGAVCKHINNLVLCSFVHQVWLREHANCSIAAGVHPARSLQDVHCGNVDGARDDRQDDGARLLQVMLQ